MSKPDEAEGPEALFSRRGLAEAAGAMGLLAVLGLTNRARAQGAATLLGPAGMQPVAVGGPNIFFTPEESAFIDFVVARLIPADGNGPSGIDAGVPNFIDKQLGGAWGGGERLFMGGPFVPDAIPQLGYQLPFTPAELFKRSIGAINGHLREANTPLATMSPEAQDAFIRDQLEGGGLGDLDGVPAQVFFEHLLEMTVQGYFSDPVYGGNKDMVTWKAIGFPGAYDSYRDTVGQHGKPFAIGPFSLADHDTMPGSDMKAMETQQ